MATGLLPVLANGLLDGTKGVDDYPWIKMHIGNPGAAGTSNPAAETTRKQVTWGTAGGTGDGIMASSADLDWTGVAGTETWTHWSAWSASTAGACGFTGTMPPKPWTAGDDATVPAGEVAVSFTLAS